MSRILTPIIAVSLRKGDLFTFTRGLSCMEYADVTYRVLRLYDRRQQGIGPSYRYTRSISLPAENAFFIVHRL